MTALATVNDILARLTSGFELRENFAIDQRVANSQMFTFGNPVVWTYTVPAMPSGVSAFIPVKLDCSLFGGYVTLSKAVNLGSLNISTNVFTDGSQMPTVTELGVSRQVAGGILVVVETALNATPGNLTVTYVDQDGNAAEASPSTALVASSIAGSAALLNLNSPDWGAMDVTTAARAAGTTPTGVLRFYGLIPIGQVAVVGAGVGSPASLALLGLDFNPVRLAAGDVVILTRGRVVTAGGFVGSLQFVGDTP